MRLKIAGGASRIEKTIKEEAKREKEGQKARETRHRNGA